MNTRDIAREAVRSRLSQVAVELFRKEGFEQVTFDTLAEAAGVSRSTFIRYFGTKEDAVLSTFDAKGERVVDALRNRPAGEDEWAALRHALGILVEEYQHDPVGTLALSRLILETPALAKRQFDKQRRWRPLMAEALAERAGSASPTLPQQVRAAAALDCVYLAVEQWHSSDGTLDLTALLDDAFAVVAAG
ncbi:TetR/AcrR family transcriptional regulator [Streptomyces sp. NPDC102364]|uniref:TetR/AcrR family transcriptional regulator n=1 Tax=Streptomyces sp. NPDC102364 TaxID=3366161 RepID=UPI00381385A9